MAKQDKNILVEEAAKKLGLGVHSLRVALQQGLFDFGVAIKTTDNRYTYYINPKKFHAYLEGHDEKQTYTLCNGDGFFDFHDKCDRTSYQ